MPAIMHHVRNWCSQYHHTWASCPGRQPLSQSLWLSVKHTSYGSLVWSDALFQYSNQYYANPFSFYSSLPLKIPFGEIFNLYYFCQCQFIFIFRIHSLRHPCRAALVTNSTVCGVWGTDSANLFSLLKYQDCWHKCRSVNSVIWILNIFFILCYTWILLQFNL